MSKRYKVEKSNIVIIITPIAVALILFATYHFTTSLLNHFNWLELLLAVFLFAIILYFFLESPRYITLTDSHLILKKMFGNLVINLGEIEEIRPYSASSFNYRLLGSGGLFGFIGVFQNKEVGKYRAYVGDYKQAFIVETKNKKNFVLSCENCAEVINIVKSSIS